MTQTISDLICELIELKVAILEIEVGEAMHFDARRDPSLVIKAARDRLAVVKWEIDLRTEGL